MAEAPVPMPQPKPKRKYTKRKKVQKIGALGKAKNREYPEPAMPPPAPPRPRYGAPKALEEVDRQLAQAIAQKPAYHEQLANLYAQTTLTEQKLNRLTQQIQELIAVQRQLDGEQGVTASSAMTFGPVSVPASTHPGPMFGEVPQGVGSIPAKQPQANPAGNVADRAKGNQGWE